MTMKFLLAIIASAAMSVSLVPSADATPAGGMPIGARTSQPIGHYEFCQRYASECRPNAKDAGPLALTQNIWDALVQVNYQVNLIPAQKDIEIYGVEEYWAYPTTAADCEDYVLQKRRLLIKQGLSPANLLIAVVLQPSGEGHAVLVVRTDKGDFVLDNLRGEIRDWSKTEYTYLKRQDSGDPGKWVKINDGRDTMAVGGIR
jgi:predicted transglutaminase-like cysteine proteinase